MNNFFSNTVTSQNEFIINRQLHDQSFISITENKLETLSLKGITTMSKEDQSILNNLDRALGFEAFTRLKEELRSLPSSLK